MLKKRARRRRARCSIPDDHSAQILLTKHTCVRLGATCVKRRRGGRVASTAAVAAIGRDAGGRRRALGVDVVDTESHGSRLAFLRKVRGRGVSGAELVVSDARPGLVRALG